ncbi:MAG: hypothetical protein DDT31_01940 [Syntrophomonadaceae bacterium]|nr:hypothetical protein [Bacillota bacterium]
MTQALTLGRAMFSNEMFRKPVPSLKWVITGGGEKNLTIFDADVTIKCSP